MNSNQTMNHHRNPDHIEFDDETISKLFGTEAAEDENFSRLQSYYVKNKTHKNLVSNIQIRILVGHKGIGKSAIFQMAQHEDMMNHKISIIIHPDDIAEFGKKGNDFHQMIRDWKEGLIEKITSRVLDNLDLEIDNSLIKSGVKGTGKIINFISLIFKKKIEENVNLLPAKELAIKQFLSERNIIVYIDDLDRGWESKREDIQRISALLNAIRDLCNENPGLKIRISLRSDVYYLVRTSDESTDKIEGYVLWHSWTNHDILLLLIKRIEAFFGRDFDVVSYKATHQKDLANFLNPIFAKRFEDSGKWSNAPMYRVLMSLIRKRPRDLVKLCSLAARNAYERDSNIITTTNLKEIFSEYSQGRIQDTINEYKSELPSIERLILGMKPSKKELRASKGWIYSTPELTSKIKNIMEGGEFRLKNGNKATAKELAQFLYKINFLTARKDLEDGTIVRYYFEEKQYLAPVVSDFGYLWEIHPAFRWALSPDDNSIPLKEVDLSNED